MSRNDVAVQVLHAEEEHEAELPSPLAECGKLQPSVATGVPLLTITSNSTRGLSNYSPIAANSHTKASLKTGPKSLWN